jgi:hypothetical protein
MPARDSIHDPVKSALLKAGWFVTDDPYVISYDGLFQEPIGKLVLRDLPLRLVVVDIELQEVSQWIPNPFD